MSRFVPGIEPQDPCDVCLFHLDILETNTLFHKHLNCLSACQNPNNTEPPFFRANLGFVRAEPSALSPPPSSVHEEIDWAIDRGRPVILEAFSNRQEEGFNTGDQF